MSSDPNTLTETLCADRDGLFGFVVVWQIHPAAVQLKAYRVVENDPRPLFICIGGGSTDVTPDPDEAEVELEGFIKWDGCSEFTMGPVHWCEPYYYKQHFRLLEALYRRAQELIVEGGNYEPWDEK